MSEVIIRDFHAHTYFRAETATAAEEFRQKIGRQFGPRLRHFGKLIHKPIGPHPTPMFEIDFNVEDFSEIVMFLMKNHGELSVLIHPQSNYGDFIDHSKHALWLGTQLPLNFEVFND